MTNTIKTMDRVQAVYKQLETAYETMLCIEENIDTLTEDLQDASGEHRDELQADLAAELERKERTAAEIKALDLVLDMCAKQLSK